MSKCIYCGKEYDAMLHGLKVCTQDKTRRTYWCGSDCMGNTPNARTVEGFAVGNMYLPKDERYCLQETGERGEVVRGEDGELHFIPALRLGNR